MGLEEVCASPVVAENVVYFGSTDHYIYAVDLQSGALKWKSKTGSGVTSSPAVENGLVYFGSYDGIFYAVDAETGKLKWKFQTAGERRYAGTHLHGSQPAAESMLAIMADHVPSGVGHALGRNAGGNSLDNTIRFLTIVPTEWVLCEVTISGVANGVAHGAMRLFAQDGRLMATASQSMILRLRDDGAR